jgi:membrane protein implicated in regulation of membrane protease activity
MSWWGWIIWGAVLLGLELSLVSAQYYLVFIGVAAVATGLTCLLLPMLPEWGQWAVFSMLALGSLVAFRGRLYARIQGPTPSVRTGPQGGVFPLPSPLMPGASCQAEHGGSFWTVRNDSEVLIAAGANVRIVGVRGLTLLVRPDNPS